MKSANGLSLQIQVCTVENYTDLASGLVSASAGSERASAVPPGGKDLPSPSLLCTYLFSILKRQCNSF